MNIVFFLLYFESVNYRFFSFWILVEVMVVLFLKVIRKSVKVSIFEYLGILFRLIVFFKYFFNML